MNLKQKGNVYLVLDSANETDEKILNYRNQLGLDDGPEISVNLTYHGSWVDSETTIDDHIVYQSNGSRGVSNGWDTVKITFFLST